MSGGEINRRKMLKSLLAITAASGFSMLSTCQYSHLSTPLEGLDSDAVQVIGRFYLNQFPQDHEVWAVKKIMSDISQSNEQMIKLLQQLMRSDFENNQTVNLFGWNVSRTEARVFAAAADMMKQ